MDTTIWKKDAKYREEGVENAAAAAPTSPPEEEEEEEEE